MNKTKIEWCDYTWNPVTGCYHECPYCYARKIATRFKGTKGFPNGFEYTFHEERMKEPYKLKKPSKIFVSSMGDLFGKWVSKEVIDKIIKVAKETPQHTYLFLTKNFNRYYMLDEFPENCWFGATPYDATKASCLADAFELIGRNVNKFVSFEPLQEEMTETMDWKEKTFQWVIIGAQTSPEKQPKKEWIDNIVKKAKEYNVPIFMKDNLKYENKIQEFPELMK